MAKLTFWEALDRVNDGFHVKPAEVQSRALNRRIWIAEWLLPGCLSESSAVCVSKREAIETACAFADYPRGMRSDLRRTGRSDRQPADAYIRGAITTISRGRFSDIL